MITLRSQNGSCYLHCLTHALQSNEVKTIIRELKQTDSATVKKQISVKK